MPDRTFHDLILVSLSTSSPNILPHSQYPSHTGFSQWPRTLEALLCLRASAHTSACFLFPLCFFTHFRLYMCNLLWKPFLNHPTQREFPIICNSLFYCLMLSYFCLSPWIIRKETTKNRGKTQKPKREERKTSKDKKKEEKARRLKEIAMQSLTFLEKKVHRSF